MFSNRNPDLVIRIALAALALIASATLAESGRCVSADVPAPIVLPDGSARPAGRLSVCFARELSPGTALHAIRIDGRVLGLFASRRGGSADGDDADRAFFVFVRDPRGRWKLEGYAIRGAEGLDTFVLTPLDNRAEALTLARRWDDLPATANDDSRLLLSRSAN